MYHDFHRINPLIRLGYLLISSSLLLFIDETLLLYYIAIYKLINKYIYAK